MHWFIPPPTETPKGNTQRFPSKILQFWSQIFKKTMNPVLCGFLYSLDRSLYQNPSELPAKWWVEKNQPALLVTSLPWGQDMADEKTMHDVKKMSSVSIHHCKYLSIHEPIWKWVKRNVSLVAQEEYANQTGLGLQFNFEVALLTNTDRNAASWQTYNSEQQSVWDGAEWWGKERKKERKSRGGCRDAGHQIKASLYY